MDLARAISPYHRPATYQRLLHAILPGWRPEVSIFQSAAAVGSVSRRSFTKACRIEVNRNLASRLSVGGDNIDTQFIAYGFSSRAEGLNWAWYRMQRPNNISGRECEAKANGSRWGRQLCAIQAGSTARKGFARRSRAPGAHADYGVEPVHQLCDIARKVIDIAAHMATQRASSADRYPARVPTLSLYVSRQSVFSVLSNVGNHQR